MKVRWVAFLWFLTIVMQVVLRSRQGLSGMPSPNAFVGPTIIASLAAGISAIPGGALFGGVLQVAYTVDLFLRIQSGTPATPDGGSSATAPATTTNKKGKAAA